MTRASALVIRPLAQSPQAGHFARFLEGGIQIGSAECPTYCRAGLRPRDSSSFRRCDGEWGQQKTCELALL